MRFYASRRQVRLSGSGQCGMEQHLTLVTQRISLERCIDYLEIGRKPLAEVWPDTSLVGEIIVDDVHAPIGNVCLPVGQVGMFGIEVTPLFP